MRFLIGAWLFCLMGYILTGCTISIGNGPKETTEEKQRQRNEELVKSCYKQCEPFTLIGFNPSDYRCICHAVKP